MMRGLVIHAALLLVAGCATAADREPSTGNKWLEGTWLMTGPDLEFPAACASGLPITYDRRGTYSLFDESGTWELEGNRLSETATEAHEDVIEPTEVQIGVTFVSRIQRRGRDMFRKTFADGRTETFRRCPIVR